MCVPAIFEFIYLIYIFCYIKIICCLSEIQLYLGILYFFWLPLLRAGTKDFSICLPPSLQRYHHSHSPIALKHCLSKIHFLY